MRSETSEYRTIKADDGMVLTNGETFAKTVAMPLEADESVWREITEAEAQETIARMESDAE